MTHLSRHAAMESEVIRHPMSSPQIAKLHRNNGTMQHRVHQITRHHVAKEGHLGSGGGPIIEGSGFHGNQPDGTRSQPMAAHFNPGDLFIDLEESADSDDLDHDPTEGRVTSQGLFIPDEAEEPETLEIPPDSNLGYEHVMHQAMRDLGLHHTQMPAEE